MTLQAWASQREYLWWSPSFHCGLRMPRKCFSKWQSIHKLWFVPQWDAGWVLCCGICVSCYTRDQSLKKNSEKTCSMLLLLRQTYKDVSKEESTQRKKIFEILIVIDGKFKHKGINKLKVKGRVWRCSNWEWNIEQKIPLDFSKGKWFCSVSDQQELSAGHKKWSARSELTAWGYLRAWW